MPEASGIAASGRAGIHVATGIVTGNENRVDHAGGLRDRRVRASRTNKAPRPIGAAGAAPGRGGMILCLGPQKPRSGPL
jgi:hypothetical protein